MDLSNSIFIIVIFVALIAVWIVPSLAGVQIISTIIMLFQFAIIYYHAKIIAKEP